jgi:hypothetical protein
MVKCTICNAIEGKEKLLVSKLDSLIKHLGQRKCVKAKPRVKIGEYYLNPTNQYVKNENLYASPGHDSIVTLWCKCKQGEEEEKLSLVYFIVASIGRRSTHEEL